MCQNVSSLSPVVITARGLACITRCIVPVNVITKLTCFPADCLSVQPVCTLGHVHAETCTTFFTFDSAVRRQDNHEYNVGPKDLHILCILPIFCEILTDSLINLLLNLLRVLGLEPRKVFLLYIIYIIYFLLFCYIL